ncbi:hypothetical protein [Aeromonas jandaei]|uniref:hypothetical protein n=1 Tax=Aeromonas jandaei TaxID=650 RepID=UPI003BA2464B
MNIVSLRLVLMALLLAVVWGQSEAAALPQAHLTFHLAISDGERAEVKATVENKGGQMIHRGYIVISAYDAQCRSTGDILQPFSELPAGKSSTVTIPLPFGSQGYHVTAFKTFDSFNFATPAVDDTVALLAGRTGEIKAQCEEKRLPAVRD